MPKSDRSLSFILPPTPWINRRIVLLSGIITLVIEVLIIAITGWSIYTHHTDNRWTRAIANLVAYPAIVIDGTVITYDRFAWEVRTRTFYAAAHQQEASRTDTEDFVINQLMNRALYRHLLANNGLNISRDDVEKQLQAITSEIGGEGKLQAYLSENYGPGMGLTEFRLLLSDSLVEATVQERLLVRATVQHILITVPEGADQAVIDAGKRRAEDVRAKIVAGAAFGEIAKQYSDDIGSRDSNGLLGTTVRGESSQYGGDFESAVFSTPISEVSEPIRSPFGWHLLLVEKREGGIDQSLEDLTRDLRANAKSRIYVSSTAD